MGWFWSDAPLQSQVRIQQTPPPPPPSHHVFSPDGTPPAGCPMHKRTLDALGSASPSKDQPSSCPISHDAASDSTTSATPSTLSRLNPLNYMFRDLSQSRAPGQSVSLPTSRDESTIPKGSGDGNWEYPSPQQMYNALLRKGYTDTDATAVESMVAVHNFLNEGAWAEIVDWERRFGRGLARGWQISRKGEEHAPAITAQMERSEGSEATPSLIRFQGRPKDMTPKAAFLQLMGRIYPSKFNNEPPFDRHDWYVARSVNGQQKEVRYVIDYYSGPPEPTGEPVFYLDVRPAVTPTAAAERMIRWGCDVWWRAIGGDVREQNR